MEQDLQAGAENPQAAQQTLRGVRVLIVADSSTTHTHRWAKWAKEAGCVVTVLSPFADPIEGVAVEKFPPEKRWYHRIPKAKMLLDYLPFRRLISRIDPQLIHFHFVSEGGRAFYWNRVRVPMIASTWGQDVIFDRSPNPKVETSLRKMLSRCRHVTATTHQLSRETMRYMPAGRPVYVIPFGVDIERFSPEVSGRAEDAQRPVVLGFVKWMLPKYGPDVLVEAFAKIHAAKPYTRLLMAGRGDMRPQIEKRVAELGLGGAIEILGRVEHEKVSALIRSFDLMVMPSVYESETFGVAAVEASACGVPVVASRVGGVPEAVIDQKTGILVPPRDVEALAAACIRLIDDAELRRKMGQAGRRFVERYYDWRANTQLMGEIYRSALAGDSPQGVPVYQPGQAPDLAVPE